MKVIFLDFDGVITTLESGWCLCPKKMQLLGEIIEKTDARIVISSSWRRHTLEETIEFISGGSIHSKSNQFPYCDKVIGITDRMYAFSYSDPIHELSGKRPHYLIPRGVEIDRWLKGNGHDVENYVILDDNDDMLYCQRNNYVQTDAYKGLSEENVEQAIKILNRK